MADHLNSGRFAGDPKSWNHFFTEKKERISKELQERVGAIVLFCNAYFN